MKLYLASTDDGCALWGVFFDGRRNDGDGGIDIHHEWFMMARSEDEVHTALDGVVRDTKNRYTNWYSEPTVVFRPVSPGELTVCSRQPGGCLTQIALHRGSTAGLHISPAIMDTRV